MFQYISCCSLSYSQQKIKGEIIKFQYISCCSLSAGLGIADSVPDSFQYISCCSLSRLKFLLILTGISFNTSHVVVYLVTSRGSVTNLIRFNTSHVVVYLRVSSYAIASDRFQYISCCSLSAVCAMAFSWSSGFNTSHVVVYLL